MEKISDFSLKNMKNKLGKYTMENKKIIFIYSGSWFFLWMHILYFPSDYRPLTLVMLLPFFPMAFIKIVNIKFNKFKLVVTLFFYILVLSFSILYFIFLILQDF